MLSLFKLSTKNILIWGVSLIMIALIWISTVALTLLLENSPPLLLVVIVCLIASIFSTSTHLGLLLSTFIENKRVFQWKLWITMLLIGGLLFSVSLLFNIRFLAGRSIEMNVVFFTPTAISLTLHAIQLASLIQMKRKLDWQDQ